MSERYTTVSIETVRAVAPEGVRIFKPQELPACTVGLAHRWHYGVQCLDCGVWRGGFGIPRRELYRWPELRDVVEHAHRPELEE